MEEKDYQDKLKKIEAAYEQAKKNLYIEYGLSQAIFKKGDIIKDHRWTMLVDKITVSVGFDRIPVPVYAGPELKKDLKPKANNNHVSIYGNKGVELIKSV